MRGLAPADTLTGKVQRALTDEWQRQDRIVYQMGPLTRSEHANIRSLLDRLVAEGRAESRYIRDLKFFTGGYTEFRKPS